MSDSSKDSARGDFAAANGFRSGDALVDRGIALLRWEGFSVQQAAATGYAMRTILLLNEKKGEAAVILMSTRGYPQVAESGERIEAPLLFPAAVPLGLGQVLERLENGLADRLQDTPFLQWLPVREVQLQPLVPAAELLCVALGAFVPCLLAYTILRSAGRRAVFALLVVTAGVLVTALSAALSWGPAHAWAWLSLPVRLGLLFGLLLAALMLAVPRRGCAAVLLLVLVVHLSVLNQAPASAYFTDTLQSWEQGRFIRFHGLAQWLGWIWPYTVLVYVLLRLSRREAAPTMPA